MYTILISLLNTAFWLVLHFGTGLFFSYLPKKIQLKLYDYTRSYYKVSDKEKQILSVLKVSRWKDALPQFNMLFDKSTIAYCAFIKQHIKLRKGVLPARNF